MTTLRHTEPTPVAWQARPGIYVPAIFHPDQGPEMFWRRCKPTIMEAMEHARRVMWWRRIRTNEAKRHLAAVSDPWWVEVVASMNLKPKLFHTPVNRERCGWQGWGNA
jgi:hypothetical protein